MQTFQVLNYSHEDFQSLERFWLISDVVRREDSGRAVHLFRMKFKRPNFVPEQDLFLAKKNGDILGFIHVIFEQEIQRAILEGYMNSEYKGKGIASELMDRALQRAEEHQAAVVHACVPELKAAVKKFLQLWGFKFVRTFLLMEAPLIERETAADGLEPALIRAFSEGEEDHLADVQNRVFFGTWGFCPNTLEEIQYYLDQTNSQISRILSLNIGSKRAGYFWGHRISGHSDQARARVHMFGILPEFRGQSWGRKLLLAGLESLRRRGATTVELTVDSANTAACSLYRSFGFEVVSKVLWFEKKIDQI